MADSDYLAEKIAKYIRNINDRHKVNHTLQRLAQMDMTVELLTRTGIGKVVNRLAREEDEDHADLALSIVSKWKETAQNQQERDRSRSPVERKVKKEIKSEIKEEEPSNGYHDDSHYHKASSSSSSNNNDRKRKVKEEPAAHGYPEERREKKKSKPAAAPAANGFLAALASGDSIKSNKPKKLKSFDISLDIDPNYRPMPSISLSSKHVKADEPFDETQMFKPRVGQTKIFAGRKKAAMLTAVPRLFDCCIAVLQHHINDIDSFGSIPYHIVKPILEKCTWQQLRNLERRNPYLEEDTDELWERLIEKHHAGKPTGKHETWKEMFMRCERESNNKLSEISRRITEQGTAAHDKIRKVVAITDIKMPRGSRRRQNGGPAVIDMPSALSLSKARKQIFESGSKASLSLMPNTVQNRSSTLGASSHRKREVTSSSSSSSRPVGPKKGHLMAKTLKMLGQKRK